MASKRPRKKQPSPPTDSAACALPAEPTSAAEQTQGQSPESANHAGHQIIAARYESFSGPLPSPDVLERYEQILPGAAERIITMAEAEQSHRHTIERKDYAEAKLGQVFGFVLGALGLIGSVFVSILGSGWAGSALGGTTVLGLVAVFVVGRTKSDAANNDAVPSSDNTPQNRKPHRQR